MGIIHCKGQQLPKWVKDSSELRFDTLTCTWVNRKVKDTLIGGKHALLYPSGEYYIIPEAYIIHRKRITP